MAEVESETVGPKVGAGKELPSRAVLKVQVQTPGGPGKKDQEGRGSDRYKAYWFAPVQAPLMRGLLGPKGLYMLARPLLLGLHSCIVPGDAEGGVTVTPSQASPDSPSPAYPFV